MKEFFVFVVCMMCSVTGMAAPDLASIAAGSASISQDQFQTIIQQSSGKAILNWNHFDIASDHHVIFQQPNTASFTLNRVSNAFFPTFIDGRITANGSIAIVNPQGIIIGPTGIINTASFVASTYDILDSDIMDSNNVLSFNFAPFLSSTILHQGQIDVGSNGKIIIHAPRIELNNGSIKGDQALATLTTADSITFDLSHGYNHLNLLLSGGDIDIQNSAIANAGEGSIDIISGGLVNINDSRIQSSGGDINIESAFGDIHLNNNTIASRGSGNGGSVTIESFASAPFALGSSENFEILSQNNVTETGNGGDIVIRSPQIFGDQNCIQSGNITCTFQGQALSFPRSRYQVEVEKQVKKLRENVEEKVVTLSNDSIEAMTVDAGSYLDIQFDDSLSAEDK